MAERGGQVGQGGVAAASQHLGVGRAGERPVHPHHDLARAGRGIGHLLKAQIQGAVEAKGTHAGSR